MSHLRGAGATRADVAGPKNPLVAQDASLGVLLVVQELLECVETILFL